MISPQGPTRLTPSSPPAHIPATHPMDKFTHIIKIDGTPVTFEERKGEEFPWVGVFTHNGEEYEWATNLTPTTDDNDSDFYRSADAAIKHLKRNG